MLRDGAADAPPSHVVVVATLGAPERRRLRGRRSRDAPPEPAPVPVTTSRVTVIDAQPHEPAAAERWLAAEATADAAAALRQVRRLVRAHRVAAADPDVPLPRSSHALVVRVGYGRGEQVADGRWDAARELALDAGPRRPGGRSRPSVLRPQERLAALAGGRAATLLCEQLALDARRDLDDGAPALAALHLRAALDAALAELPTSAEAARLAGRIAELRALREEIVPLADAALSGGLPPAASEPLPRALARLESALRARAAVAQA